jgi:hypothetical protein
VKQNFQALVLDQKMALCREEGLQRNLTELEVEMLQETEDEGQETEQIMCTAGARSSFLPSTNW